MHEPVRLPFYAWLSERTALSYRGKIMVIAFLGTHVPLLTLVAFFAWTRAATTEEALATMGVALVATLLGTAATLWSLDQLLRPLTATSVALRDFLAQRTIPELPDHHPDEAGRLMADTVTTLRGLDALLAKHEELDLRTGLLSTDGFAASADGVLTLHAGRAWSVVAIDLLRAADASTYARDDLHRIVRAVADHVGEADGAPTVVGRADDRTLLVLVEGDDLETVATALRHALERPVEHAPPTFAAQARLGIATFPTDGETAASLAERALAAVHRPGDAPVAYWDAASHRALHDRQALLADATEALEASAFDIALQPLVALDTGEVVGHEALVRWTHPSRGDVPPAAFLPLLVAARAMDQLLDLVLDRALATVDLGDDAYVSVNLHPTDLRAADLTERVAGALARHGVAPGRLVLEVTEASPIDDPETAIAALGALRALGVRIALDDFGTGTSSLARLAALPVDMVKLDRAFVAGVVDDPRVAGMVSGVVTVVESLGLGLVAEGIETADQREALVALGVGVGQGWFLGRPARPAATTAGAA